MSDIKNSIQQRIDSELNYKRALYSILNICLEKKSVQDAKRAILENPEMKNSAQEPITLFAWLTNCKALNQLEEEGVLYLQTTQEGKEVLEEYTKTDRIGNLLKKEPQHISIYNLLLDSCKTGKTRQEIEKLLENNPLVKSGELYASYFVDCLEEAGGLFWDSKWITSKKGLEKLS